MGRDQKLIGILSRAKPDYGPEPIMTSPTLRWSERAVKLKGGDSTASDFQGYTVKMNVKMSFFDVVCKVTK
jgi:hypothetical protein